MPGGNPSKIVPHQYKKGQSGNPKGRPKMPDLKGAIAEILSEKQVGKDGKKHRAIDVVLKALRKKAMQGDVRAVEVLLNRSYGMPTQKIEAEVTQIVYTPPSLSGEPDADSD